MNLDSFKTQVTILCIVALAPIITLLIRGSIWGADSFGYWAYSCGTYVSGLGLHPDFFLAFAKNVIGCNLWTLAGIMFFLYFFALLGIWVIGKHFFEAHQAFRLPIYVGCLTPLFFIEVLRFESEFFGFTIALIGIGIIHIILNKRSDSNGNIR